MTCCLATKSIKSSVAYVKLLDTPLYIILKYCHQKFIVYDKTYTKVAQIRTAGRKDIKLCCTGSNVMHMYYLCKHCWQDNA